MRLPAAVLLVAVATLTPPVPASPAPPAVAHAATESPVSIIMDGRPLAPDVPPQIIDGRTMVPLRAVFDALGADVAWDPATRTITAHRGDRTMRLAVGNTSALIDGMQVSLDAPPVLVGGRTLVPLRFVAESFGAEVGWDPILRTVTLTSAGGGGITSEVPAPSGGAPVADAIDVVGPVSAALVASVQAELPKLWRGVADALGVPDRLRKVPPVILLGDRESYRLRLVEEGFSPLAAARIAGRADGSTNGDRIFVVAGAEAVNPLWTLAHELGHVAVHRLGLEMPQWLEEGLVEYIARSLVEGDLRTALGSRYWAVVREQVFDLAAAGKLEDLFDDNTDFVDRLGDYPAHAQAMLAVTLLWDRWGEQAITAYLNELKAGTPHPQAFAAAFGLPVDDFQSLFRNHLTQGARVESSRVRVVLEVPRAVKGSLTVFAPGHRRADSWELSGAGQVSVRYDPTGGVTVGGAVNPNTGRYWTLDEAPDDLVVYLIPDQAVRVGDLQVEQAMVFIDVSYGYWYWLGTGATLSDGSTYESTDQPDLDGLLRVLEVRTL